MSSDESATALGRVRGLGPSRHGGEHWLQDKALGAALVLLGTWLIASLLMLPARDQETLRLWLQTPWGAVPMALFILAAFRHGFEGMKVVVDDYVHDEGNRFALNTFFQFLAVTGAAVSLFALGRIAFGAQA